MRQSFFCPFLWRSVSQSERRVLRSNPSNLLHFLRCCSFPVIPKHPPTSQEFHNKCPLRGASVKPERRSPGTDHQTHIVVVFPAPLWPRKDVMWFW